MISHAGHTAIPSTAGERTSWQLSYLFGFGPESPIRCHPGLLHATDKTPDNYLEKHFIQIPPFTGPQTSAAQTVGVSVAKLETQTPNGLISESEAAHGHHLFNVAITNGEADLASAHDATIPVAFVIS